MILIDPRVAKGEITYIAATIFDWFLTVFADRSFYRPGTGQAASGSTVSDMKTPNMEKEDGAKREKTRLA